MVEGELSVIKISMFAFKYKDNRLGCDVWCCVYLGFRQAKNREAEERGDAEELEHKIRRKVCNRLFSSVVFVCVRVCIYCCTHCT